MSRNFELYLEDILDAIRKVEKYTEDLKYDDFLKDELVIDGVIKNLLVIGEAVKNLSPELKGTYSKVEWKKIAGLRDVLIHSYYNLDAQILWQIINQKIPELKKAILEIRSY